METKIKELFATLLEVSTDDINENTMPQDLEKWDSFQHIVLVSAFEEELNVSVEPEDVVDMYKDYQTFKKIILQKLS